VSRVPETPTGCPRAIAPPFTFRIERSISPIAPSSPSFSRQYFAEAIAISFAMTCAAKASFSSISPMSRNATPARFSATGVACVGPRPIRAGSSPTNE